MPLAWGSEPPVSGAIGERAGEDGRRLSFEMKVMPPVRAKSPEIAARRRKS